MAKQKQSDNKTVTQAARDYILHPEKPGCWNPHHNSLRRRYLIALAVANGVSPQAMLDRHDPDINEASN